MYRLNESMIDRRVFLCFVLFGLAGGDSLFAQVVGAAQNAETTLTGDVLAKTLYAKTPAEKKYCETVIAARDAKILPDRIFYAAYRYAIKKDKDRRFIYFQTVLTQFCKEAGITLQAPKAPKSAFNPFSFFFGNTR